MNDIAQVVILEHHPLFREGIATILKNEADFEVVEQGSSTAESDKLATNLLPYLVILDIDMPESSLTAAQMISMQYPVSKIVFLALSETDDNLMKAFETGARAYFLKGVSGQELVRNLKAVHSGESYLPPALAASLYHEIHSPKPVPSSQHDLMDELTEREREILEKLADGLSNKEKGLQLHLAEKTVKH